MYAYLNIAATKTQLNMKRHAEAHVAGEVGGGVEDPRLPSVRRLVGHQQMAPQHDNGSAH